MYYSVYVRLLPKDVTKVELIELFSECGKVKDVYIHHGNQQRYYYGFIRFADPESVLRVVQDVQEWSLRGNVLEVEIATQTREAMRMYTGAYQPSPDAVKRDSEVRSRLKDCVHHINKHVDVVSGSPLLNSAGVVKEVESMPSRYAPKLSGSCCNISLISTEDILSKVTDGIFGDGDPVSEEKKKREFVDILQGLMGELQIHLSGNVSKHRVENSDKQGDSPLKARDKGSKGNEPEVHNDSVPSTDQENSACLPPNNDLNVGACGFQQDAPKSSLPTNSPLASGGCHPNVSSSASPDENTGKVHSKGFRVPVASEGHDNWNLKSNTQSLNYRSQLNTSNHGTEFQSNGTHLHKFGPHQHKFSFGKPPEQTSDVTYAQPASVTESSRSLLNGPDHLLKGRTDEFLEMLTDSVNNFASSSSLSLPLSPKSLVRKPENSSNGKSDEFYDSLVSNCSKQCAPKSKTKDLRRSDSGIDIHRSFEQRSSDSGSSHDESLNVSKSPPGARVQLRERFGEKRTNPDDSFVVSVQRYDLHRQQMQAGLSQTDTSRPAVSSPDECQLGSKVSPGCTSERMFPGGRGRGGLLKLLQAQLESEESWDGSAPSKTSLVSGVGRGARLLRMLQK